MSAEDHHRGALIETARDELTRAHRGAVSIEAGEMRRGLTLALAALREAASDAPDLAELADSVAAALAELDTGALATMESRIEAARTKLDALPL